MMIPSDDDEHENENGHKDDNDSDDPSDDDYDDYDDDDDDDDDGLLFLFPYLLPNPVPFHHNPGPHHGPHLGDVQS